MRVAPPVLHGMIPGSYPTVVELFDIIHEDRELLVINKPAGLVCHPTKGDVYSSLISRVRLHLGPDSQPHITRERAGNQGFIFTLSSCGSMLTYNFAAGIVASIFMRRSSSR